MNTVKSVIVGPLHPPSPSPCLAHARFANEQDGSKDVVTGKSHQESEKARLNEQEAPADERGVVKKTVDGVMHLVDVLADQGDKK